MKNKELFKNNMFLSSEIFNKDLTEALLLAYWETLKPYSDGQCEKAFKKVFTECTFFPKPAELIQFIKKLEKPIPVEDISLIESNKIIMHVKAEGANKYPILNDPITKHLMTRRWPYQSWASQVLESEFTWWQKEFCAAYQACDKTTIDHLKIEGPEKVMSLMTNITRPVVVEKKKLRLKPILHKKLRNKKTDDEKTEHRNKILTQKAALLNVA